MFSGALLLLTDSLCVYPRPVLRRTFRETSFAAGKRPVHPRMFDLTFNRESRHLASILLLLLKEERRLITNQPDSARFSQISRILPNQQDSPEPARFSRIGQTPSLRIPASESSGHSATASIHRAISLHSFPQLRDSVVSPHPPSRDSSGSFGFVGIDRVGPGPLFIDCSLDVLCPLVGLLVYGHRPFSLCPRGLFVFVVYAYGPYRLSLRALAFI